MKKILIIIMSLFLLVGCENKNMDEDTSIVTPTPTNEVNDTLKFKKEYSVGSIKVNVNDDDLINYLSSSEALELIKNGTGIVYFGRPTCEWCRNAVNVLLDAARVSDTTINYLNPGELDSEQITDFVKIKNILKLDGYLNEDTMHLPDVYFIKNGVIVGRHYSTVDSQLDASISLNEEQYKELLSIYQNNISLIK